MALVITVETGSDAGRRFELTGAVSTIGRDATCAVALTDPDKHVSRVHATINERDGAYFLSINSKVNHVLINGRPFRFGQTTQIQHGDQITLPPFDLRVALTGAVVAAVPVAAPPALASPAPVPASSPAAPGAVPPAAVSLLGAGVRPAAASAGKAAPAADWFTSGTDFSRTASIDPFGLSDLVQRPAGHAPAAQIDPFAAEAPKPTAARALVTDVGATGLSMSAILPAQASPLMDLIKAGAYTALDTPSQFGSNASASSIDAFLGNSSGPVSGADPLGLGNLFGSASPASLPGSSLGVPGSGGGPLVDFGGHRRSATGMAADHVHDVNLPFMPPSVHTTQTVARGPSVQAQPAAVPVALVAAVAPSSGTVSPGISSVSPAASGPSGVLSKIDDLLAGLDGIGGAAGGGVEAAFIDLDAPIPDPFAAPQNLQKTAALLSFPADAPAYGPRPAVPAVPPPAAFAAPATPSALSADPLAGLGDIFAEDTFPGVRKANPVAAPPGLSAAPAATAAGVVPTAPAEPAEPLVDASRVASTALLEAFLDGVGLQHLQLKPGEEEAFMRLAGEIVRSSVAGIINLLVARSEMKKELRAEDRTMLASQDNNPLKLMADPSEALSYLFDARERAFGKFLPPVQAVDDACADIRAHEMGLVAGTRAAVEGAIKRFSPAQLEPVLAKSVKGGLLTNRNAKLWEAYLAHYEKIDADMADHLDRLFERDFLRAYTTQVKKLR